MNKNILYEDSCFFLLLLEYLSITFHATENCSSEFSGKWNYHLVFIKLTVTHRFFSLLLLSAQPCTCKAESAAQFKHCICTVACLFLDALIKNVCWLEQRAVAQAGQRRLLNMYAA